MDYIRKYYNVPAKRGGRVIYASSGYGTIVGRYNTYLRIRIDGEKQIKLYHPTWNLTYL